MELKFTVNTGVPASSVKS